MNILPKKRWHVRTKDNIARVRRDEAEAREQERKRQAKQEFAESEARINYLRKQSGLPERQNVEVIDAGAETAGSSVHCKEEDEHIDLFADYKSHIKTTNKESEKEKKEEQEKYEKQIGYLTYLGQDTNEALKLRSWYEVAPKRALVGETGVVEKDLKNKHTHDPLTLINALLPPEKPIERKRKRSTSPKAPEIFPIYTKSTNPAKSTEKTRKAKKHKKEKKRKKDKFHSKEKRCKRNKEKREEKIALEAEEIRRKHDKLEKLRKERLRREASERARQEALLGPPMPKESEPKDPKAVPTPRIVQKYNSQFNPELAKQNML